MSLDACISCLPHCMHFMSSTLHAFHVFHIACISCLPHCMHFMSSTLHAFHVFQIACRVVEPEDEVVPLRLARIDAARGIGERIEYEVPMDPAGVGQALDPNHCFGHPH